LAIAFDANLGSKQVNGQSNGTPVNLTTTAAAASAARVVVLVSYFDGGAVNRRITGVTVGGTAAAQDTIEVNGDDVFEAWSAHLAGGLAISSTIAVAFSASLNLGGVLIGAASWTGIATTAAVVTTSSSTSTGASWSSGAATNTGQADALFVGGSGSEDATAGTSSTAVSGTEVHDLYDSGDQQGIATGYKIVSAVASDSITGTLSNAGSTANTGALVIYAADAGSATAVAPGLRRFPLGV
jgi:hypothetical protein